MVDMGRKAQPTKRCCITQPPDWWVAFKNHAEAHGMNLSEFAGDAMLEHLHPKVRAKLSKRVMRGGHQPKGTTDAKQQPRRR